MSLFQQVFQKGVAVQQETNAVQTARLDSVEGTQSAILIEQKVQRKELSVQREEQNVQREKQTAMREELDGVKAQLFLHGHDNGAGKISRQTMSASPSVNACLLPPAHLRRPQRSVLI